VAARIPSTVIGGTRGAKSPKPSEAMQKITSQAAGVPHVCWTDDTGPGRVARYEAASPKRRSLTSPGRRKHSKTASVLLRYDDNEG
jgi:hypothetical protein